MLIFSFMLCLQVDNLKWMYILVMSIGTSPAPQFNIIYVFSFVFFKTPEAYVVFYIDFAFLLF